MRRKLKSGESTWGRAGERGWLQLKLKIGAENAQGGARQEQRSGRGGGRPCGEESGEEEEEI